MLYQLYNLIISSDRDLPGVLPSPQNEPEVRIRFSGFSRFAEEPHDWFMRWELPDKKPWLNVAKVEGGYLLRFNELGDFFINQDGSEIVSIPGKSIPEQTIHHLLLDQVIPLVINLRGGEALHASAILTKKGVVAFAGPAGSGKSTLAGSFVKFGYTFMSDDCLTLLDTWNGIRAIPAYPGFRLWEDAEKYLFGDGIGCKSVAHYTSKLRVSVERRPELCCTNPQPFVYLYDIPPSQENDKKPEISIKKVSPGESFMALVRCGFRLDITDPDMLTRQFNFLHKVACNIQVRQLSFPKDFASLPAVREAILADLSGTDV